MEEFFEMFEKMFKLSENKTTVKTEIIAGLTTFMTMAYIIALNPNLLTGFGAEGQDQCHLDSKNLKNSVSFKP